MNLQPSTQGLSLKRVEDSAKGTEIQIGSLPKMEKMKVFIPLAMGTPEE